MKGSQIGILSELFVASYFIKKGYIVSKPIMDHWQYDLIIDNGKILRLQIKTIYWESSKKRYVLSCTRSHSKNRQSIKWENIRYNEDSFDYLVGVELSREAIYMIPIEKILNRRSLIFFPDGVPKNIYKCFTSFENYKLVDNADNPAAVS